MPVHDWTKVRPGTFHDFHNSWITHLKEALNAGLLPSNFYAMAEQPAEDVWPDVLTLEAASPAPDSPGFSEDSSSLAGAGPTTLLAVAERPPKVSFTMHAEMAECAARRRSLVIRHATGDRIVAFVEIISPGNKHSEAAFGKFLDKAFSALRHGYHLLLIDLFPPGPFDPAGIHGAIWAEIEDARYRSPPDRPLTLAAYEARRPQTPATISPTAYVEPIAVGSVLPEMPLFIEPGWYVNAPLEETYTAAWKGVPERWRRVIETP